MIPLYRPCVRRADMEAVLDCMASDRLETGEHCRSFAKLAARRVGAVWAVGVREYHRAVSLVFEALGLSEGAVVALSPLAPAIYLDVMTDRAIRPLFIDVDPDSATITARTARESGADACDALLCDTALGRAGDVAALATLGPPLIEDISFAFGVALEGSPLGSFGRYTVAALEVEHTITAGGGALVLAGDAAARTVLEGLVDLLPKEVLLPEMNGAFAVTQLRQLNYFLRRRAEIVAGYHRAIEESCYVTLPSKICGLCSSYPVVTKFGAPEIIAYAKEQKVECRKAFATAIVARHGDALSDPIPNVTKLSRSVVEFPLYPALTESDALQVQRVLKTLP